MLTAREYVHQIFDLRQQYRDDNSWVGEWRTGSWNDPAQMTEYIVSAYKLYAATARNALKFTLLGGTEIRLEKELILNFGVTAANGIQDKVTEDIVIEEQRRRGLIASNRLNHPSARVSVRGVGSILSEKNWTPILNDSLILGCITGNQEFHLALTPAEQADYQSLEHFVTARAVFDVKTPEAIWKASAYEIWRRFLNSQKRMFFFPNGGGPRVFTREILGLAFFGYRTHITKNQLSFLPGRGARERPDFSTYLRKLREAGFHKPSNETKITGIISEFLFNDPDALGSPWPRDTKVKV